MYLGVRNRKHLVAGLLLAASVVALPAAAEQARHDGPAEPRATLSAQAASEVGQDTVEITLSAELSGASQTAVAEALNQRLESVMKQAKGQKGIEARSGAYRIWPSTDQDGKISEWRGQADIVLKSRDFPAASHLASELGDRMPVAGLSFSVSPELRAAAGLTRETMLLGMGSHFELWDVGAWSSREAEDLAKGMTEALEEFTF